jgi:hypothetical protein
MSSYALGKYAVAICDRCGQQYDYLTLRKEWTGFKVCPQCFEPRHPQSKPVRVPKEPQALHDPRPARKEPLTVFVGQTIFPQPDSISTQGVTQLGVVKVTTT